MFYKLIIFILFFNFSLFSNDFVIEEEYNNDLNELLLSENSVYSFNQENIQALYQDFKSRTYSTKFSQKPLIIIFNQDFENIDISINDKIFINQNKNKNFYLAPNIISLSSMHNKSFSYTLYKEGFYEGIVKDYAQQILLFHEIGHFFLEYNINYFEFYKEEDINSKLNYLKFSIDESFSDLFGIVLLVKYYKINKEDVKYLFKALSFYRKKYFNFKYKGGNALDSFYVDFMIDFDLILEKEDKEIGNYIFKFIKTVI
jgi:hypothetical protein